MIDIVNKNDLLKFNKKGYLKPGIHVCNLNDFINIFVAPYPNSDTRHSRKELFLKFLKKFNNNINCTDKFWINGGYTTKKENPCDIDFVIVINHDELTLNEKEFLNEIHLLLLPIRQEYKNLEREIENEGRSKRELMKTEFYVDYGCDFYILNKKNPEDENYNIYLKEKKYWLDWWGHTRENPLTGVSDTKGFIEIEYNEKMLEGV